MLRTEPLAEGVLLGKYRLLRRMGAGGMAVVFEAVHTRLAQRVAIKVLRDEHAADPVLVERFEREGRAIGKLRSRHVVRVLDVDATPAGAPYLVMELLEGTDLSDELARRGPLPVGEAVGYVLQACSALAEAHAQGIIHRDIKPSNLFLARESGAKLIKVLDFGIAQEVAGGERLTRTESVMGTPLYMAPEQFRSAREVDARADVWALGVTLHELLAGQPPFVGTAATIGISILTDPAPPLDQVRREVPPSLAAIVCRALEKDRARRYGSARELGEALAGFAEGVVIAPRSPGAAASRAATEAQTLAAAGAAVVSGAAAGAGAAARTPAEPRNATGRARVRRAALAGVVIAGALGAAALVRFSTSPASRPSRALSTALPGQAAAEPMGSAPASAAAQAAQRPEPEPPAPPVAVDASPTTVSAASASFPRAPRSTVPARAAKSATHVPSTPSATAPSSASAAPSSPPLFFPGQ
jgi:serine/threonine-protein kinase